MTSYISIPVVDHETGYVCQYLRVSLNSLFAQRNVVYLKDL